MGPNSDKQVKKRIDGTKEVQRQTETMEKAKEV